MVREEFIEDRKKTMVYKLVKVNRESTTAFSSRNKKTIRFGTSLDTVKRQQITDTYDAAGTAD